MSQSLSNAVSALDALRDMFYDVLPDDPDFLKDNPDVTEQIEKIKTALADPSAPIKETLQMLYDFDQEWFPDDLDDQELSDDYTARLENAAPYL